ncbi:MAG: 1,4-alpha-glucan branching enzyme [Myxococcales bacterium]|nr:1,4-alpha-glucan branching enzyme [Myxococcales bacterium]
MTAQPRPPEDKADKQDDPPLQELDLYLLAEGTHAQLYDVLGAHPQLRRGQPGTAFAVWAPNAETVDVIGDWNEWTPGRCVLRPIGTSGVWHGFASGVGAGARYKYRIRSRHGGYTVDKADPFAFAAEEPPRTASVVASPTFAWRDERWMNGRASRHALDAPISIYEVHLGSWLRDPQNPQRPLGYRELAPRLVEHVRRTGFTHVELMPIAEHPFYGSWGYQVTGFFAPTARHGPPEDFMFLVDALHESDIGVILDWTPAHFPEDEHGLVYFDGTHLYEHADPRLGRHAEWGSAIFNYGRNEVRSFLLSNATFWLDRYHVDGLRVDAVASMLYLDYGRQAGQWIANEHGGHENLAAVDLLQTVNGSIRASHPDALVIAEESTAWPKVTRPPGEGGLGFSLKWDMGWMHDTLAYFALDPIHRKSHHHALTFRGLYAHAEAFVLALSHDEVVYGKRSLLEKMPGDDWQKLATLRLLYAYQWALPGKKLLFQGGELGQRREWSHERSLDWHLVREAPAHARLQLLVSELNQLYRDEPALHERDADPAGFAWLAADDVDASVYAFARFGRDGARPLVAIFNCTPVPRFNYRLGVPRDGVWTERLNTDGEAFGGSNQGNFGAVEATPLPAHGQPFSLNLTLPPLGALFFVPFA